ncbi:MAG: tRNA threonylcarbamoyladenosine dehydratase [Planctomycetes bacterium]|nr:tRNA threonylcarbamoyladenosine dehydratase [Planctomycetota bacterium]
MNAEDITQTPPASAAHRDWRFERFTRLLGSGAMEVLAQSRVSVFGLGGVGGYAVEGLARSGVGCLTLVDFDRVCITNINRQLQALTETVGQPKARLMAERVLAINPKAELLVHEEFYNQESSDRLLTPAPDLVLDCIDNITAKIHLVATCVERRIPVISSLGAAAKLDPTRVKAVPLSATHTDPLGRALRRLLRRNYRMSNEDLGKITVVFSDEQVIPPTTDHGGVVCGVDCVCPGGDNPYHTCDHRRIIYGSAVFVTSVFGMVAAATAVKRLLTISQCADSGGVF